MCLCATTLPVAGRNSFEPQESSIKQARAVRIPAESIRLDGRIDDEAWRLAPAVGDFIQAEPVEGAPPTQPMEVRFAYDETALYVGARMRSPSGAKIQAPMSRRDEGDQSEYLQVEFDSYHDRRTAYMFGVTAAGVRLDHFHASDEEATADNGFDPVWEARTEVDEDGWTAELWLPFSQLRFNHSEEQVWGLNIKRYRPDVKEEVYWVVIGRTERGWSSRFGELRGIEGIEPTRRLEILPYVASSSRMTGNRAGGNPFDNGVNLKGRTGVDVKMGLGPNLTLEATVNPDFGQIEADPAEVNLSAFETTFAERRPFFLEGSNLLQGQTSNFFYSRRIGARPTTAVRGDYVNYPDAATILGAAKLTGRLSSGLSIGALSAVTDEEFARTSTAGNISRTRVAPRTLWGVTRFEQEIGAEGSNAGVQLLTVHRSLTDADPLSAILPHNAVSGAADTQIRFGRRMYEAKFSAGFTHINGAAPAMERIQRAPTHLLQRPDQPKVRLDPTRTSLTGSQFRISIEKFAGRHWLWNANTMFESPEFEPTDLGRLNYAGDIMASSRLTYRETSPGRLLRNYSFNINHSSTTYYDLGLGTRVNVGTGANLTFKNFWNATTALTFNMPGQDAQLSRGGPSMKTPSGWGVNGTLKNSTASQIRWSVTPSYKHSEIGDLTRSLTATLAIRPAPSWQLEFLPEYAHEISKRQYLTTMGGGRMESYGRRYIFGFIDRTTLSTQLRFNYTFKPDLTLDVYAEPFAASGHYDGFGELLFSRSGLLREYGKDGIRLERQADMSYRVAEGSAAFILGNPDFNVRSFRSNVVLRWEWHPGSTMYFVWQQDRSGSEAHGNRVTFSDLFGSFSASGDNVFAVKTTLWFSP